MKIVAVLVAALFMMVAVGPSFAQTQAPAPSKDTANPGAKKAKKKTASSQAPAPSKDTANASAKTAPQADQGTGANPSAKKAQ